MKSFIIVLCFGLFAVYAAKDDSSFHCHQTPVAISNDWVDMMCPCVAAVSGQIRDEMNAALTYLAMGAYFSQADSNRPGFAKLFFDHASEEREHSITLMKYLLTRGELTKGTNDLLKPLTPQTVQRYENAVDALHDALDLETSVTLKIRNVIKICENSSDVNDYELVDYLTGVFLTEQYKSQREIAGQISTLGKMMKDHGPLGEFLYDKTLL